MSSIKLSHLVSPKPSDIKETVYAFLTQLGGPTVVHLNGRDSTRCRVIVTLLHGNEPSGLKALHQLLLENFEPECDCKIIIASVLAARTEPVFSYRMLPNQADLNRCFGQHKKDLQCQLADAISELIHTYKPEAVIDLHNTSGSGPAFAVSVHNCDEHIALAAHFTQRLIYTDIRLGSLMEQNFSCPVVTIEAGGAQDDDADLTALLGMKSFMSEPDVFRLKQDIEHLHLPRRLELKPNRSLRYGGQGPMDVDLLMRQDIEKLNFGKTAAGEILGWSNLALEQVLCLDQKPHTLSDYFIIEQNALKTRKALSLFMVTTRADIAKSDCLFYFVVCD